MAQYTYFKFLNDKTTYQFRNSYIFSFNIKGTGSNLEISKMSVEQTDTVKKSGTVLNNNTQIYYGIDEVESISKGTSGTEGVGITKSLNATRFSQSSLQIKDFMLDNSDDYYGNTVIKSLQSTGTNFIGIRPNAGSFIIQKPSSANDIYNTSFTGLTIYNSNSNTAFGDHEILNKNLNYLRIDPYTKQPVIYNDIIVIDVLQADGTYATCIDNSIEVENPEGFKLKIHSDFPCRMWCNAVQFALNDSDDYGNNCLIPKGYSIVKVKKQFQNTVSAEIFFEYKKTDIAANNGILAFFNNNKRFENKTVNETNNDGTVVSKETFTSVFVIKYYDVDENITVSNINVQNKTLSIEQPKETVSANYLIKPIIKTGVKYYWTDNLRNPIRYYDDENISTIDTPLGNKKYGIRTKQNSVTGGFDGYNIPGKVVKLNSSIHQNFVYRFYNDTYMLIDQDIIDNKRSVIEEYHDSYEYKIKNQIPPLKTVDNDNVTTYTYDGVNVYFYGAVPVYHYEEYKVIFGQEEFNTYKTALADEVIQNPKNTYENFSTYKFKISYSYNNPNIKEYLPYNVLTSGIPNNKELYTFDYDTLEYEKIVNIISDDFNLEDLEIYEKVDTFIPITVEPQSYAYIYKYENDEYSHVTASSDYDGTLYYKLSIYNKSNINFDDITTDSSILNNLYYKKSNYSYLDKNERTESNNVFIKETNTYSYYKTSVHNIYDDSVHYYSVTYSLIRKHEISDDIKDNQIYIKSHYKKIETEEEYQKYKTITSTYFYKKNSDVKKTAINSTIALSDLDISGNSVYGPDIDRVYDYDDLLSEIAQAVSTDTTPIPKDITNLAAFYSIINEDVLQNKYLANNTSDGPNAGINFKFDYSGSWDDITDTLTNETTLEDIGYDIYIYTEEEYYTPISSSFVSLGSNQDFYLKRIDKIDANSFTLPDYFNTTDGDIPDEDTPTPDPIYIETPFLTYDDNDENMLSISDYDNVGRTITLSKINQYGFAKAANAEYYVKEYTYKPVTDEYLINAGIEYFVYDSRTITGELITEFKDFPNFGDDNDYYTFSYDEVTIYKNVVKNYELLPPYKTITEAIADTAYTFSYYFLKSEFFYNTYTVNTAVDVKPDGSYFTNIFTFDGTAGKTTSKLPLIQDKSTVTKYTYSLNEKVKSIISNKEQVYDIPLEYYKNYYIDVYDTSDGLNIPLKPIRLNEFTYSPEVWFDIIKDKKYDTRNYSYSLVTYIDSVTTFEYNGSQNPNAYQYIDVETLNPKVCLVDDIIVGLIFNDNYINNELYISGKKATNPNKKLTRFNIHTTKDYLFYSYAGSASVEFEAIELFECIKNTKNDLTIQSADSFNIDITKNVSFALSNEVDIDFTGAYTWHEPQHSSYLVFNGDSYTFYDVETYSGYWTRNYREVNRPLHIAAYNYYASTDTISNVSATYSFIPNSYVLTAIISHPEITYKSLINELQEYFYYTYIYDNNEYFYAFDDPVQINDDGTYVGLAFKEHPADAEEYPAHPVSLIKHTGVYKNTLIKDVTHQEPYVSYEYTPYKTAIALTNEIVPILYTQEEQAAKTHQVLVWNNDTLSYEVETVIDTNSYYAYKYYFEEKPFKVSSYFFQASYFNISNLSEIGTYITEGLKELSYNMDTQAIQMETSTNVLSGDLNSFISYYIDNSYIGNSYAYTVGYNIAYGFDLLSYTSYNNTAYMAYTVYTAIDSMSYQVTESINKYSYDINNSLAIHDNVYQESIDEASYEISYSINGFSEALRQALLGDGPLVFPAEVNIISDPISYSVINAQVTDGPTIETLNDVLTMGLIGATIEKTSYTDPLTGLLQTTIKYSYHGITDALENLKISKRTPEKNEFITEVATTLYTNIDFENEIVDNVEYDSKGRITHKQTHKANPQDMADKAIYRAGVLWNALNKAGFVEGELANVKQPVPTLPGILRK